MSDLLRVYLDPAEIAPDGYPHAWSACPDCLHGRVPFGPPDQDGEPADWAQCGNCLGCGSIKDLVRELAGHRCIRCGHPYVKGTHGSGEWSQCDGGCRHAGPLSVRAPDGIPSTRDDIGAISEGYLVLAQWRILTVHHLNRVKHDCRWWNLTSLCQRCHLTIQGKVYLERPWGRPHSDWFKPYAAGFYASAILGEDLTRQETIARLDELLDLELRELPLF